jgi:hypothetical protein
MLFGESCYGMCIQRQNILQTNDIFAFNYLIFSRDE